MAHSCSAWPVLAASFLASRSERDHEVSSAGHVVAPLGRSRACADGAHQVCGDVGYAIPPVPGRRRESTISLCRCSCHKFCPLARRKEAVPVTVWQRRCACPGAGDARTKRGDPGQSLPGHEEYWEPTSRIHGNTLKPGRTRCEPPAAPHRGRPATRYETWSSPKCEREGLMHHQNHFSTPPSTCSAAIHAPGSERPGNGRCAYSPITYR